MFKRCALFAAVMAAIPLMALAGDKPAPVTDKDFTDAIRQPADWLKIGADERVRHEYMNNLFSFNQDADSHEWNWERFRTRVWDEITPAKWLSINSRFIWEQRHFFEPKAMDEWPESDLVIDQMNVKLKSEGDVDLALTIGRQDIILGTGWLVLDGTPLDASRTLYFDAIRGQANFKKQKTTLDLAYIYQPAEPDNWYHLYGEVESLTSEQDDKGAIIYLTNKQMEKANYEAYFIYKNSDAVAANGDNADIYTLGGALSGKLCDNWSYRAEGAGQWGDRNGADLSAFGFNGKVTYGFNDQWKNRVSFGYEYLSGDDPDSSTNEAFIPLWSRWPQFSELYVYSYASATRIAEVTNLHRISLMWDSNPTDKLALQASVQALFADENTRGGSSIFSDGGSYRGTLLTGVIKYNFNRHMIGHIWSEYFMPGDFYNEDNRDAASFLRFEITFTL